MTMRCTLWLVVALMVAVGVAVLIPGSPIHLSKLLTSGARYEGRSVSHWMAGLDSPDPEVRYEALKALGNIGPEAGDDAVRAIAAILDGDQDREARHQAVMALSKMAPASRTAVPALAKALRDEEPVIRMDAAIALRRLGPEAKPAVPALIHALKDDGNRTNVGMFHFTIQDAAAMALGPASAGTDVAVPALTEALLTAKHTEMRIFAVRSLGEVGKEARAAVRHIRPLLKDEIPDIKREAEEALQKIEGKAAAGPG